MILSRRVALNGAELDQIDRRILVSGIEEAAPKFTQTTSARMGIDGARMTVDRRDNLDVTVKFGIKIRRDDMEARSELLEQVTAWAMAGGWLTVGHRPGRRLRVICSQAPAPGDQYAWNSDYSVTFRALGVPYWQQEDPNSFSISATRASERALEVGGTAPSVLELSLSNTSGSTLDDFSLSAAGSTMAFRGLGLANGETLELDHTDDGILRIRIRSAAGAWRSAMVKRTAASADELVVRPGSVPVSWVCKRAGTLVVRCFGRYY